jgi:capsular polysaccharide biosynthesis protein
MPIERILFALDGLRRHWMLFLLPLFIAAPFAAVAWKLAPNKYEAKSTILMLSANRPSDLSGSSGFPRQSAVEQVAVLEVWLKSDHVLGPLLPQLLDGRVPADAESLGVELQRLRRSLTLRLIGAAVLEIQLDGSEARGLGRKLEIIVTRLLEGVLNPEAGILSAAQLILTRREESMEEAASALAQAIKNSGLESPERVRAQLMALRTLKQSRGAESSESVPRPASSRETDLISTALSINEARAAIARDPKLVAKLEDLYDAYEDARAAYQQIKDKAGPSSTSYVRVFDAPERLTVIGRPRDPLVGSSSGTKFAIAIVLIAGLASLGLVGLAVVLDNRLRIGEDFANIAGVPVIARLHRLR